MQRKRKPQPRSHAVRIPANVFNVIKQSAASNSRSIVSEIAVIVNGYFKSNNTVGAKSQNEFLKLSGLVDDLPAGNYSETVDDVLYGER